MNLGLFGRTWLTLTALVTLTKKPPSAHTVFANSFRMQEEEGDERGREDRGHELPTFVFSLSCTTAHCDYLWSTHITSFGLTGGVVPQKHDTAWQIA